MSKKSIIGIVCGAVTLALVATGVTMYLLGFFRKKNDCNYIECDCEPEYT